MHLTKVGRFSHEELVDIFKKFDSWYAITVIPHMEMFLNLHQVTLVYFVFQAI